MKYFSIGLCAAVLMFIPLISEAATFEAGKSVYVPQSRQLAGNVYIAGGEATISSAAPRDLTVAGGRVIVNAPIWGDALIAGGTIDVLDQVSGDLRVGGGQVSISSSIGGDLIVLGGTVTVNEGVVIQGDVMVIGGSVVFNGSVNGVVRAYAGEATLNGLIRGPVIAKAGTLTLGSTANLLSSLSYESSEKVVMTEGSKVSGDVVFTQRDIPGTKNSDQIALAVFAFIGVLALVKLIGMMLGALVMTFAFKDYSLDLARNLYRTFWKSLGVGFIVAVVGPIASIALMATVVGFYLSFIAWILYAFALLMAGVYTFIFTGAFLAKAIKKDIRVSWKWTLLGGVLFAFVSLIPVFGWALSGIVYLASLGAISMSMVREMKLKMRTHSM